MVQTEYQISKMSYNLFCPFRLLLYRNRKPCREPRVNSLRAAETLISGVTPVKTFAIHNLKHVDSYKTT